MPTATLVQSEQALRGWYKNYYDIAMGLINISTSEYLADASCRNTSFLFHLPQRLNALYQPSV